MAIQLKLQAIPKNLRQARRALGYTQRDMAGLISAALSADITEATYNKWESGHRLVPLRYAKNIAWIVESPIHKVFKSADRKPKQV